MQYLALIYGEEGRWGSLSPEEREREMGEYMALSQADVTRGGSELDSIATATTVRVRGDETLVTDGPFVELKEALGGYYVFECDSFDEACKWAAKIPAAKHGAIEVRPVYVDGGEQSMKYAALLTNHADAVAAWEAMSPEEAAAARAEEVPKWDALFAELGASGALGAGYELDSPKTARTVRVRDGETLVTDGPFAETKEQIGGLMELEAEDLDAAIAIAARIPVVFRAAVELRPVIEH